MDKASIVGAFLAVAGIIAGLLIEGGNLGQILQPTAALIVFGGTMGAVLLQFPLSTVISAFRRMALVFVAPSRHNDQLIRLLISFANKARHNGVVSLDSDLQTIQDPFLKQALMLAVDGTEPAELRKIMRVSLDSAAKRGTASRCLRIRGRLLPHHRHPGRGAGAHSGDAASGQHSGGGPRHRRCLRGDHLRSRHRQSLFSAFCRKDAHPQREDHQRREMMLEGVISILEGMNPRMLEVKLSGFVADSSHQAKERAA
jgi:chemotaxis protein MotA